MTLPPQALKADVFRFPEKDNMENVQPIFLIFKLYVYLSREKTFLSVMSFMNQIRRKEKDFILKKIVLSITKMLKNRF